MKKKLVRLLLMLLFIFCLSIFINPQDVISGGGGGKEPEIIIKISTAGLSEFNKWWVDLYNDHRLLYALAVTGTMLSLGVIIGFGTDLILSLFGFKTTRIAHHE
ncbi:MAG: hypothetical protein HW421_2010 [Ignavibacteria bacterium]|nr:hypothetical protein [Ignavibacteria bacterium]